MSNIFKRINDRSIAKEVDNAIRESVSKSNISTVGGQVIIIKKLNIYLSTVSGGGAKVIING